MSGYVWSEALVKRTLAELTKPQRIGLRQVGDSVAVTGSRATFRALKNKGLINPPKGMPDRLGKATTTANGAAVYVLLCKEIGVRPQGQPHTKARLAEVFPLAAVAEASDGAVWQALPEDTPKMVELLKKPIPGSGEALAKETLAVAKALPTAQIKGLSAIYNGKLPHNIRTAQSLNSPAKGLVRYIGRSGLSVSYELTDWGMAVLDAARKDPDLSHLVNDERPVRLEGSRVGPDGERFPWGPIDRVYTFGPYAIAEYRDDASNRNKETWPNHGKRLFHVYYAEGDLPSDERDAKRSTTRVSSARSYGSFDEAVLGAVALRVDGQGTRADYFLAQLLGIRTVD